MHEHRCNAYCRPSEHCDLVYSGLVDSFTGKPSPHRLPRARWEAMLRAAYARAGYTVTALEPAAEAPPLASVPPERRALLVGDTPADSERWLVWWR